MDDEDVSPQTDNGRHGSNGDTKEKRTSRACLTCRKRKSACHLPVVNGVVTTPCERCKNTGQECVIGGSNRGGRRVRRKLAHPDPSHHNNGNNEASFIDSSLVDIAGNGHESGPRTNGYAVASAAPPAAPMYIDPALQTGDTNGVGGDRYMTSQTRESSTGPSTVDFNDLQNPSDALGILAQIASNGEVAPAYDQNLVQRHIGGHVSLDYALVRNGQLSREQVMELLLRYGQYYHPYFPLVPAASLNPANLDTTAREEVHLLTAMLVIAARDLPDDPVFNGCFEYMKALVSCLAAGEPSTVEAVEALLLLAEWTPYTSRSDAGHVGRGEEDREAWMHVGTALRIGYYLGLDRYSFTVKGDDVKDPQWQRKRLVWTACYISDRQISIRLGRAFWSRGPGPLTTLRKEDFPMLAPAGPSDEDFASIFQATLELTLLFSNVHDVLYSNPGNSMRSHLSGGYIKYIDDFRSAIYGWKSVWGTLTCSPALKATLLMSYDYLRLYTNAFAFHATVKRASPQTLDAANGNTEDQAPGRVFYNNVGAVGDARFIYEGLDAAKSLLSMVNNFVDPEKCLRFMPLRFYLYSIYCGVFLYRARCAGVLSNEEEQSVRQMVNETVNRLERAGLGLKHQGSRYSKLLKLLWDKVDRKERKNANNSTASLTNPYRPGVDQQAAPGSASGLANDSPVSTDLMGDFSWTDLDAIGNFAVNGSGGLNQNDADWWSGFLPADSNTFMFDPMSAFDDWSMGLQ